MKKTDDDCNYDPFADNESDESETDAELPDFIFFDDEDEQQSTF